MQVKSEATTVATAQNTSPTIKPQPELLDGLEYALPDKVILAERPAQPTRTGCKRCEYIDKGLIKRARKNNNQPKGLK